MKKRITILSFFTISLIGCIHDKGTLLTRSIEIGDKKCIIQQMPEEFQEGTRSGSFDYFRVIIESKLALEDSSHLSYINFGFDNSIRKIVKSDTLYPAFVHRIANGKQENFEYIVSFEKASKEREFDIYIDDHV